MSREKQTERMNGKRVEVAPQKLSQAKSLFERMKKKPGSELVQKQLTAIYEMLADFGPVFECEYDHTLTQDLGETLAGGMGNLLQVQNFPAFTKDLYAFVRLMVSIHPCVGDEGDAVITAIDKQIEEIRSVLLENAKPHVPSVG